MMLRSRAWSVIVIVAALTLAAACREVPRGAALPPQEGLPEAVARTREAIYAAAVRGDYEALRPLIGPTFHYSFGASGDPIAYWRWLEGEGVHPLEVMAAVLRLPHTISPVVSYYVWPFAYDRPIAGLTPQERELLRTIATDEQIAAWTRFNEYQWFRLGIRSDGTWAFFIAGD